MVAITSATPASAAAADSDHAVHPVDEVLAPHRLIPLGIQHVLVMYAGAVAVPLIIGRALKLPPEQIALLINADLFACGIATLIQSYGLGPLFGVKLPVMMGVTFAAVGPMVAMANDPNLGILGIFGAVIAAGIFTILIAPVISYLLPLFPPVVTGSIILMIGISLMRVGVNWAAGSAVPSAPTYGDPFQPRHGLPGAGDDPADHALPQGLPRQHRRAARHRHRLRARLVSRQDELRRRWRRRPGSR